MIKSDLKKFQELTADDLLDAATAQPPEGEGGYLIPETSRIYRKWWQLWKPKYRVINVRDRILKWIAVYEKEKKND